MDVVLPHSTDVGDEARPFPRPRFCFLSFTFESSNALGSSRKENAPNSKLQLKAWTISRDDHKAG
jgi:hypothetical protein